MLARVDGRWHRAVDGFPSTNTVKGVSPDFPSIIFDGKYGFQAAQHLGLAGTKAWIKTFGGCPALVIERFDRSSKVPLGRIHQEDMTQALGACGDEKYQMRHFPNDGKMALSVNGVYEHHRITIEDLVAEAGARPGGGESRRGLGRSGRLCPLRRSVTKGTFRPGG